MSETIVIRSGIDRLRYTLMFEALLLLLLAPVGAMVFDRDLLDIGGLSIILSLKAMLINLVYNWIIDRFDARAGRVPTQRSWYGRLLHAIGFEISLVLTSLPIVIWWLELTIWQALLVDFAVTSFVVVYTLLFTWCYDGLFPVRQKALANH